MNETGALFYQPLVQDLAEKIEFRLRQSPAPDAVAKHRNGGAA